MRRALCSAALAAMLAPGCAARSAAHGAPEPANTTKEARLNRCEGLAAEPDDGSRGELPVENGGAAPVPGSRDVVFLSTREGAPQLFRGSLDAADAAVQLTRLRDGVSDETGARHLVAPSGRHLLFKCQEGFCRADLSDGGRLVTRPGLEGSMYQFGPFLDGVRPERFYFEARRSEAPGLHILSDSFEARGSPRLLFRAPEINGWLQDISPDGRRALAIDIRSHVDWALVLIDLEAQVARRIYPRPGEVAKVRAAVFSADGRRIFAGTDGGREKALLLAFDAASGEELGAFEEAVAPTAEIVSIAESPRGDALALTLSAGNIDRIRLVDSRTLSADPRARFEAPLGVGSASAFTPDGERLILEWSTPNRPRDLYVADLETGAVARLQSAPRPPDFDVEVEAWIESIPSFDKLPIPTNIYRPKGRSRERLPVVVHLASGPQSSAKLERTPLTRFLLSEGFAVVEPNVRGAAGFGRSYELLDDGPKRVDSFEDPAAVARWLAQQPWVDPQRLVLAGASYSGYQVLVGLTLQPELWRAGIDLYGIADWRSFFETTNPGTAAVYMKEVGSPASDGPFLDSISPLRLVRGLRAPVFVYHGRDDRQVPISQSEAFLAAARQRGVPVTALLVPGEGHGMQHAETRRRVYGALRCFLREVIR